MARSIDIVIVTALEEEREAVLRKLPRHRRQNPTGDDIHIYYMANLHVKFPNGAGGTYRVVVLSLVNMGRVQAALATNDAIHRWKPRYVLLVGIAGGVGAADVHVGDVLISDQVADFELAKITVSGPQIRWDVHRADARLLSAARHVKTADWQNLITVARPGAGAPKRHIGTVATGDKVIAVEQVLTQYRETWPKLLGVEMEAGGVATAAFNSADKPGFFMVRGVSDLADQKKGSASVEKWRAYACDGAAAYAIALLRSSPLPLQEQAPGRGKGKQGTGRQQTLKGNASPTSRTRSASTISLPPERQEVTQRDKDLFLTAALKDIRLYFRRALTALKRGRKDIDTELTEISPRKFTATIYVKGEVRNRCKIWLGESFFAQGVCYIDGRNISIDQDNSQSGLFSIDSTATGLFLRTSDYIVRQSGQQNGLLTAQETAGHLWQRFCLPLSR
jgi:5'-methylthioadenosine/S-adenosylhomocysteine nucleosidase